MHLFSCKTKFSQKHLNRHHRSIGCVLLLEDKNSMCRTMFVSRLWMWSNAICSRYSRTDTVHMSVFGPKFFSCKTYFIVGPNFLLLSVIIFAVSRSEGRISATGWPADGQMNFRHVSNFGWPTQVLAKLEQTHSNIPQDHWLFSHCQVTEGVKTLQWHDASNCIWGCLRVAYWVARLPSSPNVLTPLFLEVLMNRKAQSESLNLYCPLFKGKSESWSWQVFFSHTQRERSRCGLTVQCELSKHELWLSYANNWLLQYNFKPYHLEPSSKRSLKSK